jgi:hypothetical protein
MRLSIRAACVLLGLIGASMVALVALPSGCGGQDVIIARSDPTDAAGEDATPSDGGAGGMPCSSKHGHHWWCPDGGSSNSGCQDDGGNPCFGDDDARAGPLTMDGGGMDGDVSQPCSSNADCPQSDSFCAKASCDAGQGECKEAPLLCDDVSGDAGAVVCGCDGVDYWNDCLRRRDGVASSTHGQCTSPAVTCTADKACPVPDAVCFIEASGQCSGATEGICWVPPDGVCLADAGPGNWQSCPTSNGCVNLCTAIQMAAQSGKEFVRSGMGCR